MQEDYNRNTTAKTMHLSQCTMIIVSAADKQCHSERSEESDLRRNVLTGSFTLFRMTPDGGEGA